MIDQLKFYKTATEMAASSLNPEQALPNLFEYVRTIMPLEAMAHIAYDAEIRNVRIRSMRTATYSAQPNHIIRLTPEMQKTFTGGGGNPGVELCDLGASDFGI